MTCCFRQSLPACLATPFTPPSLSSCSAGIPGTMQRELHVQLHAFQLPCSPLWLASHMLFGWDAEGVIATGCICFPNSWMMRDVIMLSRLRPIS